MRQTDDDDDGDGDSAMNGKRSSESAVQQERDNLSDGD